MKFGKQTSLRRRVVLSGAGVHSNVPVRLVLHPAEADSGIVFLRTGLAGDRECAIEANWANVSMTQLCTVIGEGPQATVSTVEHLLAALAGLGVDNVLIEIDGPEVPIMDGSAADFVDAIDQAGIVTLNASRRYIKVMRPVRVEHGRSRSELLPAEQGFRLEIEIDYPSRVIGRQSKSLDLEPGRFRREIARARTFGQLRDVETLWKAGFALGSSLDNSVALDDERILNPEGLRFSGEFVCHKTLDAVGDLALAGAPIIGLYRSYCPGHRMNHAILEALFADAGNYRIVEAPTRREGMRADLSGAVMPAFAPLTN